MRCKRHSLDLSSNIGVCASCLRERLFSLAASSAVTQNDVVSSLAPPLVFPRSVSPYVAPRKSSASSRDDSNTRFFSTPQVGHLKKDQSCGGEESSSEEKIRSFKKKKQSHLSRFSSFFRTRSDVYDSRGNNNDNNKLSSQDSCELSFSSSSSSKSWLSRILSVKSKKVSRTCYIEDLIESESNGPRHRFCRGMSPSGDTEMESQRRTPATTTTTTTPGRRKTPMNGLGRTVSEMGFCLSPLVRAKPTNRKGKFATEFGYSGELLKSPVKPHLSTAASFCANRSKKLVDLGRLDHRR